MSFADDLRNKAGYVTRDVTTELEEARLKNQIKVADVIKKHLLYELEYQCRSAAEDGRRSAYYESFCGVYAYDDYTENWCPFEKKDDDKFDFYNQCLRYYADYSILESKGLKFEMRNALPDEYVDVVLSRYFIFDEKDANQVRQYIIDYFIKEGCKIDVIIDWHTLKYWRAPSGKLFDKNSKKVKYKKPYATFKVSISW